MAFDTGIFTQNPVSKPTQPTMSTGMQFGLSAINNAMTVDSNDIVQSVVQPMNRRRRKAAHIEAVTSGIEPGSQEYFDYMAGKLTEFGDVEGAEIVMNKKREFGLQDVQIEDVKATTATREADNILKRDKFNLDKMKTEADMENALTELEVLKGRLNNDSARVALEERQTAIEEKLAPLKAGKLAAETGNVRARTATENAMRDGAVAGQQADIDLARARIDVLGQEATGKQIDNEIAQAVGLDAATAKVEEAKANAQLIKTRASTMKDENARAELLKDAEKANLEARTEAIIAGAKADTVKAEAYARSAGMSNTKSRQVTKAVVKEVKKEIEDFVKNDGISDYDDEVAQAVAYKLEAKRVLMGDTAFQAAINGPDGRRNLVKEAYSEVTSGKITGGTKLLGVTIPGMGPEFDQGDGGVIDLGTITE